MEKNLTRLEEIGMELMYCRFALQSLLTKDKHNNNWNQTTTHLTNIHNEEEKYHDGKVVNIEPIESAKQYIMSRNPITQKIKK